ncbi:hypothetical protein POM88_018646 [Heracleum sosnowskyi]|uniref:Uncharacterized protein n=1 Tax=Heracleum sosnowskyi TaxID=360622 RepID=A0AAD8N0K6_9APIA|nr:hypothetical protein POM88_018646 [Heracleum sosnowskyi]
MAAAYSATTFFLLPSPNPTRFSTKLFVLRSSSVSSPLITRFRKQRKNYLRPKILRTRPDPLLLEPPFTIPEEILVDPQPDNPLPDPLIEEALKEYDDESLEASVLDVNSNVGLGKFSKFTVFRVGLFLVGAFVVQTICAVLLFGSGQNGVVDSEGESGGLGLSGDGVGNKVVYVDQVEMRRRIKEIQVMARDVREKERREGKNGNDEDMRGDDVGDDFSRIEKEVMRRLGKSGKGAKKMSVGHTRKDDDSKDGLVAGDFNEALLVKKAEFENLLVSKVKDFRDSDDDSISEVGNTSEVLRREALEKINDGSDGMELFDSVRTVEKANADEVRNDFVNSEEEDGSRTIELPRKKSSQGKGRVKLGKAEPLNGKAGKLDESKKLNGASPQRSKWWLNLPYVLAVVMRTDDDQEATGLYKIKSTSHSWDDSSHVVAFEDRGDATNFCYLLQSFFEHVDSFDTDIIPIPIKELDEAVTSHGMEVVVVKKGQLKLYAGQPLSEVEMSLRSLVEQS